MDHVRRLREDEPDVVRFGFAAGSARPFLCPCGYRLPAVAIVGDTALPADVRALLTTAGPLTPRLEDQQGEALTLRVLERRRRGDDYARRVVLLGADDVPVLLGAIAVDLARLPPARRAAVVAERVPFGYIVADGMARPSALLRIACDAPIATALELSIGERCLYGRRRTVVDECAALVATIVEILAPGRAQKGGSLPRHSRRQSRGEYIPRLASLGRALTRAVIAAGRGSTPTRRGGCRGSA